MDMRRFIAIVCALVAALALPGVAAAEGLDEGLFPGGTITSKEGATLTIPEGTARVYTSSFATGGKASNYQAPKSGGTFIGTFSYVVKGPCFANGVGLKVGDPWPVTYTINVGKQYAGRAITVYAEEESILESVASARVAPDGSAQVKVLWTAVDIDATPTLKMSVNIEPAASKPAGTGFADVATNAWVYTEQWLQYVTSHGIMGGYHGKFAPDAPLTRGQVAAILYRIAKPGSTETTDPKHYGTTTGFSDGGSQRYYFAAVKWLKESGISTGDRDTSGKPLDRFRPDDSITRQELAALVQRFAKLQGADMSKRGVISSFKDASKVQVYAVEPLSWCLGNNIVSGGKGVAEGLLMPGDNATRAQAAKIFTVLTRDVLKK